MTDTTNQRADLAAAERVLQGVLRRAGDIDDFEQGLMRDAWDACMAYHADPAKRQKVNDSAAGNGDVMVLTDELILAIARKHFRAGHDPKAEPAFVAAVRECLAAPAAQPISDAMMDLADRLGSEAKDVDPRAWRHLLVYAPARNGEGVALRAALQRLETACDRRSRLLTADAYNAASGLPGMTDALLELDEARKEARALLAAPAAQAPIYEVRSAHGYLAKNRPIQWVAASNGGSSWSKREIAEDMARQIRAQGTACEVVPVAAPAPKCTRCEYIGKCDCEPAPAAPTVATTIVIQSEGKTVWAGVRHHTWDETVYVELPAPAPAAQADDRPSDFELCLNEFAAIQRDLGKEGHTEKLTRQSNALYRNLLAMQSATPAEPVQATQEFDPMEFGAELNRAYVLKILVDVEAIARDRTDAHWAGFQNAIEEVRARLDVPATSDASINEITLEKLGEWPSFEAQSWACKVVHAVLATPADAASEADKRDAARWRELKLHTHETELKRGCTASEYGQANWLLNYATMDDLLDLYIERRTCSTIDAAIQRERQQGEVRA